MDGVKRTAADLRTARVIDPARIDATRPAAARFAEKAADAMVAMIEQRILKNEHPYPGADTNVALGFNSKRTFPLAARLDLTQLVAGLTTSDPELAALFSAARGQPSTKTDDGSAFGEALRQEIQRSMTQRGFEVLHQEAVAANRVGVGLAPPAPEVIVRDPEFAKQFASRQPLLMRLFSVFQR